MKKIAIQGVAGAFHELAAYKFFGCNVEIAPCITFRQECVMLKNGSADYAVMAIENTIAGTLLPNYSLISEYGLHISGETYLHIQMHLLALRNATLENIKEVWSHPIAIEQCRNYLNALPPNVAIIEKDDTAASALMIVQNNLTNVAAVAGTAAAQMYGLGCLVCNIQTHKQNFTRFLILCRHPVCNENGNKTSLCFELAHKCGSLSVALGIFAKNNINLTKIQSVPIIGKPYQYRFYVDIEWECNADHTSALQELAEHTTSCVMLGKYERGEY